MAGLGSPSRDASDRIFVPFAQLGISSARGASDANEIALRTIEERCRVALASRDVSLRRGRRFSSGRQIEVGIFVERGWDVGVFVSVLWIHGENGVHIGVSPGSRLHAKLVWSAFAAGFVVCFGAALARGMPASAELTWILAAGAGLALGVLGMLVVSRAKLGTRLEPSRALARLVVAAMRTGAGAAH